MCNGFFGEAKKESNMALDAPLFDPHRTDHSKGESIMDYTKNHHLPQWVKSDRILMDDFNQMCKDIESGMTANATAAANAQSTANAARSAANTAQSTASTALSSKPYAIGTYTGTGADITINVGFRPSFIIISGLEDFNDLSQLSHFGAYACATGGKTTAGAHIQFNSTSFTILYSHNRHPRLTENGRLYEYIAFK